MLKFAKNHAGASLSVIIYVYRRAIIVTNDNTDCHSTCSDAPRLDPTP